MKVIILAGGFARRLAPLTDFIPKPLLPLGDRLIIDHIIDNIPENFREDIIISTNSRFESQFRRWSQCRDENIKLLVEPTRKEEEKFGAIAGIRYVIEEKNINDDVLILAGDNYFGFAISDFMDFALKFEKPTIALKDIKSAEKAKRFGVAILKENNVIEQMVEKPDEPKSTLISTGCYYIPAGKLDAFRRYLDEKNNPDAPGYFFQWLVKNSDVKGYTFTEEWYDIGTLAAYREVFEQFLTKKY